MSTPVPERLANELVSRLETITVANGYPFNVAGVVRGNRDGTTVQYTHQSIRVDQGNKQRVEQMDCPGNPPALCWSQPFGIRCYTRNSNKPDDPQDPEAEMPHVTNTNEMIDAAVQAITAADNWHTMGDINFDTRLDAVDLFDADNGEYNGQMLVVTCLYRVSENDPSEVRG